MSNVIVKVNRFITLLKVSVLINRELFHPFEFSQILELVPESLGLMIKHCIQPIIHFGQLVRVPHVDSRYQIVYFVLV